MAFAVGRSMATGDGGWKIRPMASAPSSAALWASVGLVDAAEFDLGFHGCSVLLRRRWAISFRLRGEADGVADDGEGGAEEEAAFDCDEVEGEEVVAGFAEGRFLGRFCRRRL